MKKLLAILLTAVLLTASAAAVAEDFYAVSLGWAENASGQRQKTGFTESFENYGWTNYSIVDANYDPRCPDRPDPRFHRQAAHGAVHHPVRPHRHRRSGARGL